MSKNSEFENNPWGFTSSRYVYENAWIRVREDQVIRPDGKPGIYSVVEARTAVAVLALDEADNVVMVGQYRYPIAAYSWELIEGGAEPDEDPLMAAKRELQEEAGLVATDWSLLVPKIHLSNCFTSEVGMVFVAKNLEKVEATPEGTEVLQIKKIPLQEVRDKVMQGEITDSLTVLGILFYTQGVMGNK